MKFEQQIKDVLKELGLEEKHWTKITAETEEEVRLAVIKYWNGEPDRRATEATKTVTDKKQAEIDALTKTNKELEAKLGKPPGMGPDFMEKKHPPGRYTTCMT